MRAASFVTACLLLALGASAASAETTSPGIFFTIVNNCSGAVTDFAVGDKICQLEISTATYYRAIYSGTLQASDSTEAMTCTGTDGKGEVIFVPPATSSSSAVTVKVSADESVSIPSSFCSLSKTKAKPKTKTKLLRQLLHKKP